MLWTGFWSTPCTEHAVVLLWYRKSSQT